MENFKWTDELVKEFINKEFIDKYNSPFSWITGIDPIMGEKMKEFKKSRQSKKEYIILRTVTTCSSEHPGPSIANAVLYEVPTYLAQKLN